MKNIQSDATLRLLQLKHMSTLQSALAHVLEACGLHFVVHDDVESDHEPNPALHIYSSFPGRCLWLDLPFGRNLNEVYPATNEFGDVHWQLGNSGQLDHREDTFEGVVEFMLQKMANSLVAASPAWATSDDPLLRRLHELVQQNNAKG